MVKEIDVNFVKKDLYKNKAMAKFSHYAGGELFYDVKLSIGTYRFPISTVEDNVDDAYKSFKLSSDLGTTPFCVEMKGSDLNRWIAMAIKAGEFVKVS